MANRQDTCLYPSIVDALLADYLTSQFLLIHSRASP